jgi:L-cysteine/cystine lyase
VVSPFLPDDEKLAAVRTALPAVGAGIYLNAGTCGPLPAETGKAMADLEAWELTVGRATYDYYLEMLARMDEARAAVAAILTADVRTVALNHSATDGVNIGAWAADWRPGDRAVTTTDEHPGGVGGLYQLRERFALDLAFVDVGAAADDDAVVAAFDAAITPGTRLVALSHVVWTTGTRLPVGRIAELAHARGALVVVDGAQAAGTIPVDVGALGADFYAVPAQKWLLGPEGMGAVFCSPTVLDRARSTFAGWFSFEQIDSRGLATPWPDARRFEGSNYHRPSIVGMARSCGWLSMYVGLEWIHRRAAAVARRAAERLASVPGVELLTPVDRMATLVTFRIAGWDAQSALDELSARVFAIARTVPPLDAIRISVGFYNTDEEIDRFVDAVALLAGHSPETLPRRRLTILGSDG